MLIDAACMLFTCLASCCLHSALQLELQLVYGILRKESRQYYTWAGMANIGGENRLKSYKHKGQDLEEGRRRREEEGVQLRKAKRDEQVWYEIYKYLCTCSTVVGFVCASECDTRQHGILNYLRVIFCSLQLAKRRNLDVQLPPDFLEEVSYPEVRSSRLVLHAWLCYIICLVGQF